MVKTEPTKHVAAQTKNIWGEVRYLNTIVARSDPHLPINADTAHVKENDAELEDVSKWYD